MGAKPLSERKKVQSALTNDSGSDLIFLWIVTFFSVFVLVLILFPLIYVVSSSFSSGDALMAGKVIFLPVDLSLEGYKMVFEDATILTGFRNSFYYMFIGTCFNMVMTTLLAFPLSRRKLPGRNAVMFFVAFTMFFSGGLIPTFLIVDRMGMVDTLWAMVVPNVISTFNLIIMRTYFQNSLPEELFESAELDGCGNFRFLLRIALPLSKPIMAVLVLYYAVAHWNTYFNALIYLRSSNKVNLQLALRTVLMSTMAVQGEGFSEMAKVGLTLKYAAIVLSSLPVAALYPFIQKYFIKGVMVGAIKG